MPRRSAAQRQGLGRHDLLQDAQASGNMFLNVEPNAVHKAYLASHGHEFGFMREEMKEIQSRDTCAIHYWYQ